MIKSAALRTAFDVPAKQSAIADIERAMVSPHFWEDRKRAEEMAQELSGLKRDIEGVEKLRRDTDELSEMLAVAESDEVLLMEIGERAAALEKIVDRRTLEIFLSGKYDKGNAVLSVYAGAGGLDSEDWSAFLFRMYRRFAERRGWKATVLHEHWGEGRGPAGWGLKNATVEIAGPYTYGYLRRESGVHRLVRISPFSSQKLRHTSFALVDVMPEFVAPGEVEIRPEDIDIDFFRSSGPGGQNVNKRETAVRITHKPTGFQVAVQTERSQDQNRQRALELLRSRLYQLALRRQDEERRGVKSEKVSIEWGSQIRSYVMHPYQMVKDHRTDVETAQIERVLDGELDEFIDAEIKFLMPNL